jgi:putative lipoic acid-binding regulatory protein
MDKDWENSFRKKLDEHHVWPSLYVFKFIVPKGKEEQLKSMFIQHEISERVSANGNYTSFTINIMCPSGEAVINVYKMVENIDGIIAL